jgi:hypothetical protein
MFVGGWVGVRVCVHAHLQIHVYVHRHIGTHMQFTNACTYAFAYTHTHAYTYTDMHTQQKQLRAIPGVPIVFINHGQIILEHLSEVTVKTFQVYAY